jgi:signal transduction histidine kinase
MMSGVRGTSLATRFLVTLVATAALPLVLYGWLSLRGMREQIDEQVVRVFLPQLAADHAERIAAHFDKVDQACAVAREMARTALERPTELAEFAEQVELVPDLLDNHVDLLLLADPAGRVVYWRDGLRLDPSAHGRRAALIPSDVRELAWFSRTQRDRGSLYLPLGRSPLLHAEPQARSLDPAAHHLGIVLDVPHRGGAPGALFALLRWAEVQRILDEARDVLVERAQLPAAEVFLVAADGTIAAHTERRHYGLPVAPDSLADALHDARERRLGAFVGADAEPWRFGLAPLGRGERHFQLVVAAPERQLFAPSDAFAQVWLVAIGVSVLVLVAWSLWASRTIVSPVQSLVAATRRVASGDLAVAVPARGGAELGELAASFNRMAAELATGRRQLAAAEREQAWAEMARQVAHEVKNPLQPMRLLAELLQRARRDGDPRAEAIAERLARTVLEQTEQLDRIAGDFRNFAGVAPASRSELAVGEWLTGAIAALRDLFAGRKLQLELSLASADERVLGDRRALDRVLGNLVQNAVDAAPQGVRVTITATRRGGVVAITVADDGPGIDAAARARVFEPYFTTKSSGTGLGLAICRRIVEAHGGSIALLRSGTAGSTFEFEIPCLSQVAPTAPPA